MMFRLNFTRGTHTSYFCIIKIRIRDRTSEQPGHTTFQTGSRYIVRDEDVCDLKRCLFTGHERNSDDTCPGFLLQINHSLHAVFA